MINKKKAGVQTGPFSLSKLETECEIECNILRPVIATYLAIIIDRDIHSITKTFVGESQPGDEQVPFIVAALSGKAT
jgi:hypothetical protein